MTMLSEKLAFGSYAEVNYTTSDGYEYCRLCRNQEEVDQLQIDILFDPNLHVTFHSVTYYGT